MEKVIIKESALRQLVRESLKKIVAEEFANESFNEKAKKSEKSKSGNDQSRKRNILSWLRNDSVNGAEIMRRLWHPKKKEEDSKRSLFYKKRDQKPNSNGGHYEFTNSELVSLANIQSSLSSK